MYVPVPCIFPSSHSPVYRAPSGQVNSLASTPPIPFDFGCDGGPEVVFFFTILLAGSTHRRGSAQQLKVSATPLSKMLQLTKVGLAVLPSRKSFSLLLFAFLQSSNFVDVYPKKQ
mmetsp:Transcript_42194/g.86280  ORF Transcript_42194/g.86280 Transcript_42194/m.86280 type:complete len:115 (+) Transcript_42194:617-961(+)